MTRLALNLCAAWILLASAALAADYDPLAISKSFEPQVLELSVRDQTRDREIPLKVYLPAEKTPAPVLLFSHGLGGSRDMGTYLGKHWSARGYVTVFLQHAGSDDALWRNEAPGKRMEALKGAASADNLLKRLGDVPRTLDELAKWNRETGHALAGRLDLEKVGMSGHSFGAMTTQGVSGQTMPIVGAKFTDPRIKAAVVMSPSLPRAGDPKEAFGKVKLPWLLMTGTKDTSAIGGQTVESRQGVYPALPDGDKYELVLNDGAHAAFTDRPLPGETRIATHHRSILATSTAFWDAYVKQDSAAKSWLQGTGPRGVLDTADRWQKK